MVAFSDAFDFLFTIAFTDDWESLARFPVTAGGLRLRSVGAALAADAARMTTTIIISAREKYVRETVLSVVLFQLDL